MSVFNALSTAVSGINAQSTAFTNLSNNIANSQTVGYKADSTAFQDFVAGSLNGNAASEDVSDSVAAVTVQHVDQQGTSSTSTDSLASSISGNGLFVVSKETGTATSGTTQFESQNYYTRNGEIYENNSGYLVNTSGYYLDGYMVNDSTGALETNLSQLNVNNVAFRPTQTTTLTLNATVGTLPSSTAPTTGYTPQTYTATPVTTYDADANAHQVGLTWTQSATNPYVWTVSAYDAGGNGAIAANAATVTFGTNGTLKSISYPSSGGATTTVSASGAAASIPIAATYNGVAQNMTLNLGTIGGTSGTTMAASTGTASTSGIDALTTDPTTSGLMMAASPTTLGTTTGSNQSYTTAPFYDSASGSYVSAVWTQAPVTSNAATGASSSSTTWNLKFVDPYTGAASDTYQVAFDPATGAASSVTDTTTNTSGLSLSNLNVTVGGATPQSYTANLGGTQLSTSTTLATDSSALTSDSVASGTYEGIAIQSDGSVMAEFDNGDTQLVGKIALADFANVNGLNAVDGQAYTATASSGTANIGTVGQNGTGTLSVGYVESSTTDLTSDLSSLIVAQEAYSANAKVVTTADDLLQSTIAMKQG
ncbi:flagellar hook-basal body complex protein [Nguyenibacter sp. L1]|uniref:flagellar hook-basal body complex protein n=1 Tax=Nguyenibacter sp. L1 TaxID=3049350 RepID=UPI002B476AE3|nr:flagellar hook-basal body complex protein [Nguyenibacter sp. L1]WRH89711.1 flagellar hook-basal body complex protein [Nguyenibacter sp. L1]